MMRSAAATLTGAMALMLAGAPSLALSAPTPQPVDRQSAQTLGEAFQTAKNLNATPVDEQTLLNGALDGMMRTLDRGGEYLSPADLDALSERGSTVGVGLNVSTDDGVARIVQLTDGGAAAKGGLRLGDYIVAIDGKGVLGDTGSRVLRKIAGPPGSTVTVSIIRDLRERRDIVLTREAVVPPSIVSRMEGDYAYLRLGALDASATDRLDTDLRALRRDHPEVKGVVLDLRDNPGGLLDQAVSVSDLFLDKGTVFSQSGQNRDEDRRFEAHAGDQAGGLPMVVLINGGTAAGAEIIAAALQDNHRARLVGTPTFGRGSIQTVIPLRSGQGGALKVTSAYFHRPSGAAIEAIGVKPDVVAAQTAGKTAGETADSQLARAVALLKSGG